MSIAALVSATHEPIFRPSIREHPVRNGQRLRWYPNNASPWKGLQLKNVSASGAFDGSDVFKSFGMSLGTTGDDDKVYCLHINDDDQLCS